MPIRTIILLLIICFGYTPAVFAKDDTAKYCKVSKLGWHFYCDPDKEEEDKPEQKPAIKPESPEDYLARRDAVRKELDWKMARAVLEPTQEHIIDYIRTQRDKALNPANIFTEKWKRAIWTNPDIDYSLKRPVSTVGKQAWVDNRNIEKEHSINTLNERYGVFFFYSSTCIYCQKYSPILKAFAAKHNLKVIAVSMDGGIFPDWPDTVINQGQAERMGIAGKPVPATILFDKKTKEIVPVGFGLMAMDELESRIYMMTEVEVGNAY